jgi:hypothetical protein
MSFDDALGASAPYDSGQGVDDLTHQSFPCGIRDGVLADPRQLFDVRARCMDRKTRHIDEIPPEVTPSSSGELVITDSKPSSFDEVVKPSGLSNIDLFWKIATSSMALCFDAFVLLTRIRIGALSYGKRDIGGGAKPSDNWTLRLCNRHHREQRAHGDELAFWAKWGIDPFALALTY